MGLSFNPKEDGVVFFQNWLKKIHLHIDSPPNKKTALKRYLYACATQKAYKNMVVSRPSGFKSGKKLSKTM